MRHTTKEVVSTTRSQASRMFKFLAITMPLCLAFVLSFSLPAFAQPTRSAQAAVTCTANQTWLLSAPIGNTSTPQGLPGVTAWSDSSFIPGPGFSTQVANITVQIDSSTGNVCTYHLNASFTIKDSTNGTVITITAATPSSTPGTFNASTGALTLNGTLTLKNLPFTQGTVTTAPSSLSTESTVTTSAGTTITGSRVDASGNVTVVGASTFVDLVTVHSQTRFVGTFIRQS